MRVLNITNTPFCLLLASLLGPKSLAFQPATNHRHQHGHTTLDYQQTEAETSAALGDYGKAIDIYFKCKDAADEAEHCHDDIVNGTIGLPSYNLFVLSKLQQSQHPESQKDVEFPTAGSPLKPFPTSDVVQDISKIEETAFVTTKSTFAFTKMSKQSKPFSLGGRGSYLDSVSGSVALGSGVKSLDPAPEVVQKISHSHAVAKTKKLTKPFVSAGGSGSYLEEISQSPDTSSLFETPPARLISTPSMTSLVSESRLSTKDPALTSSSIPTKEGSYAVTKMSKEAKPLSPGDKTSHFKDTSSTGNTKSMSSPDNTSADLQAMMSTEAMTAEGAYTGGLSPSSDNVQSSDVSAADSAETDAILEAIMEATGASSSDGDPSASPKTIDMEYLFEDAVTQVMIEEGVVEYTDGESPSGDIITQSSDDPSADPCAPETEEMLEATCAPSVIYEGEQNLGPPITSDVEHFFVDAVAPTAPTETENPLTKAMTVDSLVNDGDRSVALSMDDPVLSERIERISLATEALMEKSDPLDVASDIAPKVVDAHVAPTKVTNPTMEPTMESSSPQGSSGNAQSMNTLAAPIEATELALEAIFESKAPLSMPHIASTSVRPAEKDKVVSSKFAKETVAALQQLSFRARLQRTVSRAIDWYKAKHFFAVYRLLLSFVSGDLSAAPNEYQSTAQGVNTTCVIG